MLEVFLLSFNAAKDEEYEMGMESVLLGLNVKQKNLPD
jgi:hypothetical protein